MALGPVSPTVLDRYELKYLIPYSMVEPISQYVSSFCDMDYYSAISSDGFYMINSLYFETPNYFFMRAKENLTSRFSMRVRSYGENPKPPYYFEVKEKIENFSKKRRGRVPLENWSQVFSTKDPIGDFDPKKDPHLQYFLNLADTYNAHPTILTQYRRRAYLSNVDSYARVTFDRSLRYAPETRYNVHPTESQMLNYDHPSTFGWSGLNVVLELKCERKVPVWMVDLIKRFHLTRLGFSKFECSMLECYSPFGIQEFAEGRVPAPHLGSQIF